MAQARWITHDSEADRLAHMDLPDQHRIKFHSSRAGEFGGHRPSLRPAREAQYEFKRRADVVGFLPNEGAIISLIGAVLLEANKEW